MNNNGVVISSQILTMFAMLAGNMRDTYMGDYLGWRHDRFEKDRCLGLATPGSRILE